MRQEMIKKSNDKGIRIAFYGKGGIGESTIASNVAAGFSILGLKVFLIGCDPKGDSTRNIMGKKIQSVIRSIQEEETMLDQINYRYQKYKGKYVFLSDL
jgi:nitrogenase iron protein NifH